MLAHVGDHRFFFTEARFGTIILLRTEYADGDGLKYADGRSLNEGWYWNHQFLIDLEKDLKFKPKPVPIKESFQYISYWQITPVTVILPAAWLCGWLWRWRRQRQRRLAGCCPSCGYDLRASEGECPECGKLIPEAKPV